MFYLPEFLTQLIDENTAFVKTDCCWLHEAQSSPSPSCLGVGDNCRGGVRVGAEQGGDGVVAAAGVIGCEHHLGGGTDRTVSSRAPEFQSAEGRSERPLEVQCKINYFNFITQFLWDQ